MHLKLYLFKNTLKNYLGRGTNDHKRNEREYNSNNDGRQRTVKVRLK